MNYNDYIKSLEKTNNLLLMRTHIKKIKLKNIPFMMNKNIVFSKYNIISGAYGAGKTFLVHLIYDAYTMGKTELEWLTEHPDYRNATAEIIYNSDTECKYSFPKKSEDFDDSRWFEEHKDICFLFDQPAILNNNIEIDGFLNYLKEIDAQILLTVDEKNDFNLPSDFKRINI